MIQVARRTIALFVALTLILTGVIPAVATDANPPEPDLTLAELGSVTHDTALKHPTLDSSLFQISQEAQAGDRPNALIARQGTVSKGESVSVSIDIDDPASLLDWLEQSGAEVSGVGERIVEAFVPVTVLEMLAEQPGVLAVRSTLPPFTNVMSQGVALHGVPNWNDNGFTGAGLKIGVIDIEFKGVQALIGTELPDVNARCYPASGPFNSNPASCDRGGVHGTAVAETVVDVAPDVSLYIANPRTWTELRATVDWMIASGVTVINHSVGWTWNGPGDGTTIYPDSPLATVDRAVAAGITWVNSAGNEGKATWSGEYLDSNNDRYLEFRQGGIDLNSVPTFQGQTINLMLRWEDSWPGASTDLDLVLLDGFGNVRAVSQQQQNGGPGDTPLEVIYYTPSESGYLYVAVYHYGGPVPDWLQFQEVKGAPLGYSTDNYSIANPAESANPGLLAVGAASWKTPGTIEDFSSRGPTRDGRIKPDVVGLDRADTVSYGPSNFPGTSQASPHVAGLAILVKQRFPHFSPADVAQYLRSNASQTHAPNNIWGYGLAYLPEISEDDHPVPSISSVDPTTIERGTHPLTVTITGNGFLEESVVRWNGVDRPTTYVSPTELTFEIESADSASVGTAQITVTNPAPGGGTSGAVTISVFDDQVAAVDYPEFLRTWQRTDDPVKYLIVERTWMWGDGPASEALTESYAESPEGQRSVKYYDKSRMEVNDPNADPSETWYVTNGLLSTELITGRMQIGDDLFEEFDPAEVPVAGDPDDTGGPTYATFTALLNAAPYAEGATIAQRIDRSGTVWTDVTLAQYGVTAAELVDVPNIRHRVASPFWEFMNSSGLIYADDLYYYDLLFENPFYATGLPITEAYWARVKVNHQNVDVLIQCFERRCLTYTPGNDLGWQVEAGNVGLHYYFWRYGTMP